MSVFSTPELLQAAKREWGIALAEFDRNALDRAVRLSIKHYSDWPPTLGQFKDLCKPMAPRHLPELPRETNEESRQRGLAALRRIKAELIKRTNAPASSGT